jgi:hypothetical protein
MSSFSGVETLGFSNFCQPCFFVPYTFKRIYEKFIMYDSIYTVYTVLSGPLTFAQVQLPLSALEGSVVRQLAGK